MTYPPRTRSRDAPVLRVPLRKRPSPQCRHRGGQLGHGGRASVAAVRGGDPKPSDRRRCDPPPVELPRLPQRLLKAGSDSVDDPKQGSAPWGADPASSSASAQSAARPRRRTAGAGRCPGTRRGTGRAGSHSDRPARKWQSDAPSVPARGCVGGKSQARGWGRTVSAGPYLPTGHTLPRRGGPPVLSRRQPRQELLCTGRRHQRPLSLLQRL